MASSIIASGNDGQWAAICKALGIADLRIDDPRPKRYLLGERGHGS